MHYPTADVKKFINGSENLINEHDNIQSSTPYPILNYYRVLNYTKLLIILY